MPNLTKQQKREAEAAIYGLNPNENMEQQFAPEDIERMRAILARHDAEKPRGIQEFDLNNPPKVPYTHQDYPRVVYHHGARKAKKVENAKEERAALTDGWQNEPYPAEAPALPELDEADAAEAVRLDAIARKPKKA